MNGDQVGEYFNALRETCGRERQAARKAGVTMHAIRDMRKHSPEFEEMEREIAKETAEIIEAEMFRRGVEGVERHKYFKGEYTHSENEYSDALLLALAKGNMPDKYGDKKQISGGLSNNVQVTIRDFSHIPNTRPGQVQDVSFSHGPQIEAHGPQIEAQVRSMTEEEIINELI